MKYAILTLASIVLFACGSGGPNKNLPITPFPDLASYRLSDFSLSKPLNYWQIETQTYDDPFLDPDFVARSSVIFQFDENIFEGLSSELQDEILSQNSNAGFSYSCIPSSCAIYGVILEEGRVDLIISEEELLELFGEIDTTAELDIWLWMSNYESRLYETTDTGYRVVAVEIYQSDVCGGTVDEDLLEVTADGTITELRRISRQQAC